MFSVAKLLNPDEDLIHKGRLHIIILLQGLLVCLLSFGFALYAPNIILNDFRPDFLLGYNYMLTAFDRYVWDRALTPDLIGFILFGGGFFIMISGIFYAVYSFVFYMGAYTVITDRRLIYKTGLFFIHIQEIEIEEIEEMHLSSGVLGNFLNYAYIYVDMRFVGEQTIPCVPKPYLFLRHLHTAHDRLHGSDIQTVITK